MKLFNKYLFISLISSLCLIGCNGPEEKIVDTDEDLYPISERTYPTWEKDDSSELLNSIQKTTFINNLGDYIDNNAFDLDNTPLTGSPKLLVIPVWFTDSSTYIRKKDNVREDIALSYFGTNEETGWRSVKTYYEELSKGTINLDGVVSPWWECGVSSTSIKSDSDVNNLVSKATNWYFSRSNAGARKSFDNDGNGHLDGVMLIYGAPDYTASSKQSDTMWAFCSWLQKNDKNIAKPTPNVYFWASYDFMYGANTALIRSGGTYATGSTLYSSLDTHTFIHEMGHAFGLEDYYDYTNKRNPAGGFSMQDFNVGSHDPYSVLNYGWARAYVPSGPMTIKIKPFQSTNDMVLLGTSSSYKTSFDEYLLFELYTPTGLNKFDTVHTYHNSYPQGVNATGIRIWHIDSRVVPYVYNTDSFDASRIGNDINAGNYGVYLAMSNTTDGDYASYLGEDYFDYNILQLIRNKTSATYAYKYNLAATDLFYNGNSFDISTFSKQFVNGTRFNNGEEFDWHVDIAISGSNENAIATLTLTK